MVREKRTITCDCCLKEVEMDEAGHYPNGWHINTEIGDLCSVCASQWEDHKTTFVTMRRKDTKGSVV